MLENVRDFDQLNQLVKNKRSEPFDEYFSGMEITREQKKERISVSEDFEDVFLPVLALLFTMQQYGMVKWETAREMLEAGYRKALSGHMGIDRNLDIYIKGFSYDFIDSTVGHQTEPYYYSEDRAKFLSENESSATCNYKDFLEAIAAGKTKKRWVDVRDNKERKTHLQVGGTEKGITKPFVVGDSLMMFPHDAMTFNAEPKELISCRCSIKYF